MDMGDERRQDLEALRLALSRPDAYPVSAKRVSIEETHISLVFLTDSRVFKLKKEVKFSFVDYSTIEARRHMCEEEVRLNKRLAPKVYLGVRPITRDGEQIKVGGKGEIIDYCVEMVRLPEAKFLDRRIASGKVSQADIDRLLDVLVPFYENQWARHELDRFSEPDMIRKNLLDNLVTCEEHAREADKYLLGRLRSSQLQFLTLRRHVFESRLAEGRIREGHGDLRPDHICLLRPPVVFDCLEFSLPLRAADVASEIAFLVMECDRSGAMDLDQRLVEGYEKRSGDNFPPGLVAFYKAYRAMVRAKVEKLRSDQLGNDGQSQSSDAARQYFLLASNYAADFHQPLLLVTIGISGSGKSSIARQLKETLGLEVIRTDAVRQELAGKRQPNAGYQEGIYSEVATRQTYDEVFEHARKWLSESVTVLIDGSFLSEIHRTRARSLAREAGARLIFLYCQIESVEAAERISRRRQKGNDISDARADLPARQIRSLESANDLQDTDVLTLDARSSVESNATAVINCLSHLTSAHSTS